MRRVIVVWLGFWLTVTAVLAYQDYTRTHGGNPTTTLAWAQTRYTTAGITLPTFRFNPNSDECGTNLAVWDGTTIRYCAEGTRMHRVMLHELAHVWATHNLTDNDRTRLITEWDTPSWGDTAVAHDWRGVEQFADMIAWALHPIRDDSCCTLTAEQMLRTLAGLGVTPLWQA